MEGPSTQPALQHHCGQAPSATPATAEAAPASRPCMAILPAAEAAQLLQQGGDAAATPEEQRKWLRAFVREQTQSADMLGAAAISGPETPACELRVTDRGLCEGGLVQNACSGAWAARRLRQHCSGPLSAPSPR